MKMKRKAAAFITAGLMAISLCVPASMTAYAGETDPYKITVEETTEGYKYKAYQIFKGDIGENDVLTNIKWADGFNSAGFLSDLQAEEAFSGAFDFDDLDDGAEVTAEDVAKAFQNIEDIQSNENLKALFAKLAKKNIGTAQAVEVTKQSDSGKYVINVTGSGYYLVEETAIPGGIPAGQEEVYSRFMLNVVGNSSVTPKRELPTLDKKITGATAKDNGKANAVNIGDSVPYELTSAVPNMTGYDKYFFVVNDDLDTGLTFNNDVQVYVDNTLIENGDTTYYTVQTAEADTDGHTFQIVFNDFYGNFKDKAGKAIKITYSATLNENAKTDTTGNLNTANLTYSNNPNVTPTGVNEPSGSDPKGKTPDSQTKTYSANLQLFKYELENSQKKALAGAKFMIKGTADKVILVNGTAYEPDDNGTYYMLNTGGYTDTAPTGETKAKYETNANGSYKKFKKVEGVKASTEKENICTEAYVGADGILTFNGLGAGVYTITELIAPAGYNKLENPITFTLTDGNHTFANGPVWTVSDNATIDNNTATAKLEIENKQGSTLPSTGGIGTKLFFVFGAAMAIGSGIYLVTKKRMAGVEE